jgi:hypothetical protein
MEILDLPIGLRRPGRWAEEAHEVVAEEERPMIAARTGRVGGDIFGWRVCFVGYLHRKPDFLAICILTLFDCFMYSFSWYRRAMS